MLVTNAQSFRFTDDFRKPEIDTHTLAHAARRIHFYADMRIMRYFYA